MLDKTLCDWCNKIITGEFLSCYYCGDILHPKCMNDVFYINGEKKYICWDCDDDDDDI